MNFIRKSGTLAAVLCGAALFFGFSALATAQSSNDGANLDGQRKMSDARFAREAAMGGMVEVEFGKLAVQKASSDRVRQFAQRMIDDHSKAGEQLKQIAAQDNIHIPSRLDARHKGRIDMFATMSGTSFDRAYMREMVKDHEMDTGEFQKEANDGRNPELKNFAAMTLPTIQEPLQMAKDTDSSLGVTSRR